VTLNNRIYNVLDHLRQYRILIEKLQAVAAAAKCTTNIEEEEMMSELVMQYVQQGAPYGLEISGLTYWVQEQLVWTRVGAAPFVLSA
jgi:hypothetical protein